MDEDEARRDGSKKGCVVVVIVLLLVFIIFGIAIWIAFKKANSPTFKVQRLAVPNFKVDNNFTDDQVVLAVDMSFYLETVNYNNMVGTKLQSMIMQVRWDDYGASLGETHVSAISQDASTKNVLKVDTHGETVIQKKNLTVEELSLDVSLSGDVVFVYGAFNTKTYPFMVTCHNVSTTSRDSVCGSIIYSEKINTNRPQKTMPLPMSSGATPSEGPAMSPAGAPSSTSEAQNVPASKQNPNAPSVQLIVKDKSVILDNGILAATITKPDGFVTGIKYNGVANILDEANPEDDRGYWDVVWAPPTKETGKKATKGKFDRLKCTVFQVITDRQDLIEISFSRTYDPAKAGKDVPLDIDIRYIMLRGESGIYSYNILKREKWPGCNIANARLAFKLSRPMFRHIVVTDNRQRKMPRPEDRMKGRGQILAYPEAVKLNNPMDAEFKGEVDDKYQYSDESHDIRVHGWISDDPPMGFWQITPSYEFRTGGPNKQFLTSHVGPSVLAMFVSAHYSGENVIPKFEDGEPWTKVLGPVFMYVNRVDKGQNTKSLWEDAKSKMLEEADAWPYSFAFSEDFPNAKQRANVSGKLFVHDTFVNPKNTPANGSFVGLATPGEAGSWQTECKGYQFWTTTKPDGSFTVENVRAGNYSLYGWVPGFIGDYKYNVSININIGHNIELGDIVYEPPRDGPTLWEIGEAERTAKEFFVPDPDPKYVNKLYTNHPDKFRQYGLWEKYSELYPKEDLIYVVNSSDYHKDWFYAQVTRKVNNGYEGTTWQIKFNLDKVDEEGIYRLRVSIAGASNAHLEVRVNEQPSPPVLVVNNMGSDNAIARHGIHGLYWLFSAEIQGKKLKVGENVLYLTQTKSSSPFQGILYDYLRLEAPSGTAPK